MYLKVIKNAKTAEEAVAIFKEKHPELRAERAQIVTASGVQRGVLLDTCDDKTAINFYAVASRIKYEEENLDYAFETRIRSFEEKFPKTQVLLAYNGWGIMYTFITIVGKTSGITTQDVQNHFRLSLIERR